MLVLNFSLVSCRPFPAAMACLFHKMFGTRSFQVSGKFNWLGD